MKDTSDQNSNERSIWCYAVLDPYLWLFGMLNDVFVLVGQYLTKIRTITKSYVFRDRV